MLAKVRPWLQSGETLIWRRARHLQRNLRPDSTPECSLTTNDVWIVVVKGAYLCRDGAGEKRVGPGEFTRVPGTTSMRRLVRAEYTNYMRIGSGGGCGTTSGSGSGPVGGTTSGSDPGSGSGSGLEPGCGLGKGGVIEAFAGSGMLLYLFLRNSIRNSIIDAGLGSSSIQRTDKGIYFGSD
jgi:hypothetical protein